MGPAARVLRRTLVDGCSVRVLAGHPELCHRARDMDARVLGKRRDGLCNCERFFQVASKWRARVFAYPPCGAQAYHAGRS